MKGRERRGNLSLKGKELVVSCHKGSFFPACGRKTRCSAISTAWRTQIFVRVENGAPPSSMYPSIPLLHEGSTWTAASSAWPKGTSSGSRSGSGSCAA